MQSSTKSDSITTTHPTIIGSENPTIRLSNGQTVSLSNFLQQSTQSQSSDGVIKPSLKTTTTTTTTPTVVNTTPVSFPVNNGVLDDTWAIDVHLQNIELQTRKQDRTYQRYLEELCPEFRNPSLIQQILKSTEIKMGRDDEHKSGLTFITTKAISELKADGKHIKVDDKPTEIGCGALYRKECWCTKRDRNGNSIAIRRSQRPRLSERPKITQKLNPQTASAAAAKVGTTLSSAAGLNGTALQPMTATALNTAAVLGMNLGTTNGLRSSLPNYRLQNGYPHNLNNHSLLQQPQPLWSHYLHPTILQRNSALLSMLTANPAAAATINPATVANPGGGTSANSNSTTNSDANNAAATATGANPTIAPQPDFNTMCQQIFKLWNPLSGGGALGNAAAPSILLSAGLPNVAVPTNTATASLVTTASSATATASTATVTASAAASTTTKDTHRYENGAPAPKRRKRSRWQ